MSSQADRPTVVSDFDDVLIRHDGSLDKRWSQSTNRIYRDLIVTTGHWMHRIGDAGTFRFNQRLDDDRHAGRRLGAVALEHVVHHSFIPHRSPEIFDCLANRFG